jgi:NitT/TauT family transport system substrate-binding protein
MRSLREGVGEAAMGLRWGTGSHARFSRRRFLRGLSLAGTAGLLSLPRRGYPEPPPETTRLRMFLSPSLCVAPQFVAEELLHAEGFTDVQYVRNEPGEIEKLLIAGDLDINTQFSAPLIIHVDAGAPVVFLAGVHVGCFELFGAGNVRAIRDLKGKRIAIRAVGSVQHVFLASMLAHVGFDPRKDVTFVTQLPAESKQLLAEGKIDAFLGFPPDPQELRAKKIGRVIVNSALDRPWSQYFCCMVAGNREFVRKHPVATKRALRALLKATDICVTQPERVARTLVDKGLTSRYDYALQTMKDVPYDRWRTYDPEDTLRFYALRLHEAGMIKGSPRKILAQGTDWRFLNELRRELKG